MMVGPGMACLWLYGHGQAHHIHTDNSHNNPATYLRRHSWKGNLVSLAPLLLVAAAHTKSMQTSKISGAGLEETSAQAIRFKQSLEGLGGHLKLPYKAKQAKRYHEFRKKNKTRKRHQQTYLRRLMHLLLVGCCVAVITIITYLKI